MGITQHNTGTANVKLIADLLLMRGNFGKPGAGICPLRGHSNVQGNRTVGITEKPSPEFLAKLEAEFGFTPPQGHGHDAVQAMEAMVDGSARALICLGGNFAVALPDPELCFAAMKELTLSVHLAPSSTARTCWLGARPSCCRCWGAPSWTSRPTARNQ